MTLAIAYRALHDWGLQDSEVSLVAQRENKVFKVTEQSGKCYALRLHRPEYQTVKALTSELKWIEHLKTCGIEVPEVVLTNIGNRLVEYNGHQVSLLSWLDGCPLGATGKPLALEQRNQRFFELGQLIARVHRESDAWTQPADFERAYWDKDGLVGDAPLWGPFWENPALNNKQADLFSRMRQHTHAVLTDPELDFGLIHADMVRENILVSQSGLQLIDFDDSGYGYRLFDVATALYKNREEPDAPALQSALIDGYHSIRTLDETLLSLFFVLRSLTYVGWIMTRMNEPDATERQLRFVSTATQLSEAYLAIAE